VEENVYKLGVWEDACKEDFALVDRKLKDEVGRGSEDEAFTAALGISSHRD